MTSATESLRGARDQLLALHGQHTRARAEFRWPDVGARFNWAHDWFDTYARGNDRPGLVIVEEDGSAAAHTFDDLVHRARLAVARGRDGHALSRGTC